MCAHAHTHPPTLFLNKLTIFLLSKTKVTAFSRETAGVKEGTPTVRSLLLRINQSKTIILAIIPFSASQLMQQSITKEDEGQNNLCK